jgi:hypothetical protein
MGYEIIFYYHEKLEDEYDKSNIKELHKKLGKKEEEIDLEKLGRFILTHLARRDIWITKVKVFEYKKTEISFRETKGGIVVKNKKFLLDGNLDITYLDEEEQQPQPKQVYFQQSVPQTVPVFTQQQTQPQQPDFEPEPELKMIFYPEDHPVNAKLFTKFKLTNNKSYAIYGSKKDSTGLEQYKIKNNLGNFVYVSEIHFVPEKLNLSNVGEITEQDNGDISLDFGETVNL